MSNTEKPRNLIDKYRQWETDLIREDVQKNTFPYAVAMQNFQGDFNIGTVIRNGNAFGAKAIYYIGGKRHWDRRGDVGARHYSCVTYLPNVEDLAKLKADFVFVGLENNIDFRKPYLMADFVWPKNPLILLGEENAGLTADVLELCDYLVEIPMHGSVRSLNCGTASGIAMWDYVNKLKIPAETQL